MKQSKHHTLYSQGLTLIELMITVVILGIIAAVAVPSYNQYLQNARRSDARLALLRISNEMEKFYSNNLRYPDSLGQLGVSSVSPDGYYDLSYTSTGNATGYSLTAAAKSDESQAKDTYCATFTLDSSGEEGGTHDDCW